MKKNIRSLTLVLCLSCVAACDENNNFVIFSVENDVQLGQQVHNEIANSPEYEILPPESFPQAYSYLYSLRDAILNSGEIAYRDEFEWNLYILKDDQIQNAFATPGGYIYIYTGLIKYLDHADDLAGVLGHEMAHADLRHTVRNLQKIYGVNLLLAIALGNEPSQLEQIAAQIAGTLAGLSFSRQFEEEADGQSVEYLSHTQYACNGAALFFIKMNEEGDGAQPPEFLSTHPNPDNRIEAINAKAESIGCDTSLSGDTQFNIIKGTL
ncbi:MAG TPA: M48 family metalloprotease [Cyclobacteriaceae bacterium]|nr:M48 family metalloprotease [Cyclobacteriaceae bacterium]